MIDVLEILWVFLGAAVCVPVAVLAFETTKAGQSKRHPRGAGTSLELPSAHSKTQHTATPRTAVLIPAHNEATGLVATLAPLLAGADERFAVWVVADNCTDATATIARDAGAHVVERNDSERRGKGYALHTGVQALRQWAPEVTVVLDADCQASAAGIKALAAACHQHQRPLQAAYLMQAPVGAGLGLRIAEFAWRVKTWARPLGWRMAGQGGSLLGSGMAFPAALMYSLPLDSGHITEDLSLSFRLAEQGQTPLFWPETTVYSEFPVSEAAQMSQRTRWEHGHLGILLTEVPKALGSGLIRGQPAQWALGLYTLVPPMALLVVALAGAWLLAVATAVLGGLWWPLGLISLAGVALAGTLLYAWHRWARDIMPASDWLQIPAYIWRKLGIYQKWAQKPETQWTRTERNVHRPSPHNAPPEDSGGPHAK